MELSALRSYIGFFGIAFYGVICVRTVVRFPAIIIKVRKILDKSDKMNLFSILQPSPTKICHVLMTTRNKCIILEKKII